MRPCETGITRTVEPLMKRALTILALSALPVFADEPAKKTTSAPAAEAARPTVISGATASAADSPLVAAAKRTNRGSKKSVHKITNANLGKYGSGSARITTTEKQEPITMPAPLAEPVQTPEMKVIAEREAARKTAQVEAAKKQKDEADKRAKAAQAAERNEEGMYGETDADAGYGDGQQPEPQQQEKKPPQV